MENKAVEIVNDYNNTEELLKKFPVEHKTHVEKGIGEKIRNRLLTGFENWNRGFDAWKAWGDILYTPESIYNVHGARLSLAEYQAAMNVTLKRVNIQMGAFHDMIICDNWCAIYYGISTIAGGREIPGSVIEFVNFKDYGPELGARVFEGWGGPKDNGYQGMAMFRGEKNTEIQKKQFEDLLNYRIPETDDLAEKYPVKYPVSSYGEMAEQMREVILKNFDRWNRGFENWSASVRETFTKDAKCTDAKNNVMDVEGYIEALKGQSDARRLYFDSMLLNGEFAAIHYWTVRKNPETGMEEPFDTMQILQFVKEGGTVKVAACWTK